MISLDEIINCTRVEGGSWAYPHARRLIELVRWIASGAGYDEQVMFYAAYLHDWGAFETYRQPGVDHPLRSRQVAESQVLPQTSLTPGQVERVLEAIELHDYRSAGLSRFAETSLLRQADCLDLLGTIGLARELAWGPNDLPKVAARIRGRWEAMRACLTLPRARQMGEERILEMEEFFRRLEQQSYGWL